MSATLFGYNCNMELGIRPCVDEESLLVSFHVSGNASFKVCLMDVSKDTCSNFEVDVDIVILGHRKLNTVSKDGSFTPKCPLYVSLNRIGLNETLIFLAMMLQDSMSRIRHLIMPLYCNFLRH